MRFPRPVLSLALLLSAPALADGWVDNVNGLSIDRDGKVDHFRGLVIAPDGHIARVLRNGDRPPQKADFRLDGQGRTLLPGFIDSNTHVIQTGLAALSLDLSGATSLGGAQARIAAYATAHPDRPWIIGFGWNADRWGLGRLPTAAELDGVTGAKPAWLISLDGHQGWANGAAKTAAGLSATSKVPSGGRIEGGVFIDAAMDLVQRAVPALSAKDRDLALGAAQKLFLQNGVTSVADMGSSRNDWDTFRRAGDGGRLTIRIFAYSAGLEPMLAITAGEPTPWLYEDRLRLGGVAYLADGGLESRDACLKKPYADRASTSGSCFNSDAKLRNLMSRAAMDGLQVAVDASGDRATAQVLDAVEDLALTYQDERRWRVEGARLVDRADMPRLGQNHVIVSAQPLQQAGERQAVEQRLGPDRSVDAFGWASILRYGANLSFGSGTPAAAPDAFAGIGSAITREDASGQPFGGWQPQERVSREQALAAYTTGGAYAAFAETRVGRIAPGLWADFILVDTDPLQSTIAQLRATHVSEVWVAGKRVFKATATPPTRPR